MDKKRKPVNKKHKRIMAMLLSCVLSVCVFTAIPIQAKADVSITDLWNEMINFGYKKIEAVGNKVEDAKKEIQDAIAEKAKDAISEYFDEQTAEVLNEAIDAQAYLKSSSDTTAYVNQAVWIGIWAAFGGDLTDDEKDKNIFDDSFDAKDFVTNGKGHDFQEVFRVFGYSLVLLFFAVSLVDQTIKYEIFTLRGAVGIFGRLIISKTVIDTSSWICITIINISESLCGQLLATTRRTILETNVPSITVETSDVFIVGPIVDYIVACIISLPIYLLTLTVLISGLFILVKLLLRSFELSLLTAVSPAFFACASSNATMPYFKNFITQFIKSAFQIVFMVVVYFVAINHITFQGTNITTFAELGVWFIKSIPNTVIIIAMSIMMVKPPRFLTDLIR